MTSQEFDTLYRKEFPILYRVAYSILRDGEECRDLINEVFADLLDNDRPIENVEAYLYKAVRNRAISMISRKSTIEKVRELYPIEQSVNEVYDFDYDRKLLQVMQFLDSELTPTARQVVRLVFERGVSYKDAAEQLNVSVAAINKHVVKSLRLLREKFCRKNNQ